MKYFILNCTTFILATLISLGFVEAGLRIFKIFPPPDAISSQKPDIYAPDNEVGYHLWPSIQTFERYPSTALKISDITSNSDGFRNSREFGKARDNKKLLMIGDSFVYGLGVQSKDRLTEVLESKLSGWQIDNLGMCGWGIDLMLRALETFGPKIKPHIVVLAVYTDDFPRVLPQFSGIGFKIPKFELHNGELVTKPYQLASGWRKLHLAQTAYEIYWRKIVNRNRFDLNKSILDRFYQATQKLNSKFVLLYLPGKGDTDVDKERRSFLETWSKNQKIPYLDLHDAFHNAGIKKTYIKGDIHWNENGHRLAATKIADFLVNSVRIETLSQ